MNDDSASGVPTESELRALREHAQAVSGAIAAELRSEMARQMMSNRKLSQRLAELGEPRSEPTLSRILRGKQPLGLIDLYAICEVLGISVREVVVDAEKKVADGKH